MMDKNKDAKLSYDEFAEGSKKDPTIVQVRARSRSSVSHDQLCYGLSS